MTLKRITFLQDLLAFMGLEGRLHLEWISSAEARKFAQVVTDFTRTIERLGPNPLVGEETKTSEVLKTSEVSGGGFSRHHGLTRADTPVRPCQ